MQEFVSLYRQLLYKGERKENRTGVVTLHKFGHQMRFRMKDGFPICTRKKVSFHNVKHELLWFLTGSSNIEYLKQNKVTIWDEWADENGELGPVYGVQWRHWNGHKDQISELIWRMQHDPLDRRLVVTAWNPSNVKECGLPPCHLLFQFNCRPVPVLPVYKGAKWLVDVQIYQRSCDTFLGVPYNVSSYALLLHMVTQVAGPEFAAGDLIWVGGDVHLYENHIQQAQEYITRQQHPLPRLQMNPLITDIDEFKGEDLQLVDYVHSGPLTGEVAV